MANKKVTELTELAATPANGDLIEIVDVSDTTMAATGTNKKITRANLVGGLASSSHAHASTDLSDSAQLRRTTDADLPVADGGTGASTAANARTNLGVVIGTDVMAHVAPGADGNVLTSDGAGNWVSEAPAGGGGGGSFTPFFHWYNPCNQTSGSAAYVSAGVSANIGPGVSITATSGSPTQYMGAHIGSDYENALKYSGGWGVGHVAYWHMNPLLADYTTAGSIKLLVGDDYTDVGSTHAATGSYGFYTDQASGIMYAFSYSGTTETRTNITASLAGLSKNALFAAVYTPSTNIKFYTNGALVATISTNLPSSSGTWIGSCGVNVRTDTASNVAAFLSYHGIYMNLY